MNEYVFKVACCLSWMTTVWVINQLLFTQKIMTHEAGYPGYVYMCTVLSGTGTCVCFLLMEAASAASEVMNYCCC